MLFYKRTHRIRHCFEALVLIGLIWGGTGVYHHFHDPQDSQPRTERNASSQQKSAPRQNSQAKPQQNNSQHRHFDTGKAKATATNSAKSFWQRNKASIIASAVVLLFVLGILTS